MEMCCILRKLNVFWNILIVQKKKDKKWVYCLCFIKLIFITVSYLCAKGIVFTEMHSAVKDIKLFINMLIILFYTPVPTMVLQPNDNSIASY